MKLKKLTICLDMFGCPNRCRHCWLGHGANAHMAADDLRETAQAFQPYAKDLSVFSWYREPDFPDHYRELYALEAALSTKPHDPLHFENASMWRLTRDAGYAPWLRSLGVRRVQITLFGGPAMTDYYTGRKGAYEDILAAFDTLIRSGIAPRVQAFAFKDNIDEMVLVEALIREQRLEERCAAIGVPFTAFIAAPSCCGAALELYDKWLTPSDVSKFPPLLVQYSLAHWKTSNFRSIFGKPEGEWVTELANSKNTQRIVSRTPTLYIDRNFEVYPNLSHPAPYWSLGNLRADSAQAVLENYCQSRSIAQHARLHTPFGEMVRVCGNANSQRMLDKGDFVDLILNRYCEISGKSKQ